MRTGRITYGELKDKVERCAAFLRRIGIKRGDVVTIQLPNRIAFPIVFFALELIGAIANKVNPDFRVRELELHPANSPAAAPSCARASSRGFDYVGDGDGSCEHAMPGLDARRRRGRRRRRDASNLERGHCANARRSPPSDRVTHEPRRDLPHGLHVGHDRRSQMRAALLQHDAAGRAPDQRRHEGDRAGRAARLPAGRASTGATCACCRRSWSGGRAVLLERFSARGGAGADPARARHLHRHGAGLDRGHAQRARARQATTSPRCASSSPAAPRRRSRPSATTRRACPAT